MLPRIMVNAFNQSEWATLTVSPDRKEDIMHRITARWLSLIPLAAVAVALFWAWN